MKLLLKGKMQKEKLSEREVELLQLCSEGKKIEEIASQVYLSPSTVKSSITRTFLKLGVNNREQAMSVAIEKGYIPGPSVNDTPFESLNSKEEKILRLLPGGFTNEEIGKRLNLTARTVKSAIATISHKLHASGKIQLAALAQKKYGSS